jgi:hypothetical protein
MISAPAITGRCGICFFWNGPLPVLCRRYRFLLPQYVSAAHANGKAIRTANLRKQRSRPKMDVEYFCQPSTAALVPLSARKADIYGHPNLYFG